MLHFISYISSLVQLRRGIIQSTFHLFVEGHTVPFIARYRASMVGNIGAEQLYILQNYYKEFVTMDKTRMNRMEKLRQRSLLSPFLEKSFQECVSMDQLDDLWQPYKAEKKESDLLKASSIEGLSELAQELLAVRSATKQLGPLSMKTSEKFPDFPPQKGLLVILIQTIATDPKVREVVKTFLSTNIEVSSKLKRNLDKDEKTRSKFRDYDNYNRRLHTIPHHQMLALRRGKDENGELSVKVNVTSESAVVALMHRILEKFQVHAQSSRVHVSVDDAKYKQFLEQFCRTNRQTILLDRNRLVGETCCEALRNHLVKSVTNELYKDAIKRAEEKALNVFAINLRNILMVPPLKEFHQQSSLSSSSSANRECGHVICGIDPGVKHGHKIAILDSNQKLVATAVLKYNSDPNACVAKLAEICARHNVNICSIGDGVGCLEAQEMVGKMLNIRKRDELTKDSFGYVVVSEAGASVYSASKVATIEYPNVEITYLGAISIAERLRNPLSELVKIQPASLGVGMYQRDLGEKVMDARLTEVVELCLNEVGVDLHTSSIHLMKRVSGLSSKQAEAIIEAARAGNIKCREDLMKIKGFGPIAFKNATGFLKIKGGDNPLDNTSIHPEQYGIVHKLLDTTGFLKLHGKLEHYHISGNCSSLYESFKAVKNWNVVAEKVAADLPTVLDLVSWLLSSNPFSTDNSNYKLQNIDNFKQRRMCEVGIPPEIKIMAPSSLRSDPVIMGRNYSGKKVNKESLRTGSVVLGTIRNITPFGAFIDLGVEGRMLNDSRLHTGLLHSSEIDLNTVIIGQSIEVVIKKLDKERGRVGLSVHQNNYDATNKDESIEKLGKSNILKRNVGAQEDEDGSEEKRKRRKIRNSSTSTPYL